jgi:hypothetical protein
MYLIYPIYKIRLIYKINQSLSPPQRLLLAMITISIEIHFTAGGSWNTAEALGEGAH